MKVKVPRCAGCKTAHDAAETMVWAGAGLSGIVCALVLAVVASVSAFAPVPVGVFVGWFVGFMFGINFGMAIGSIRLWKAGVLRVESTAQFGPVKQMRSEGWTVGEKPAGASLQEAARI
jgi:hypothetical protein